MKIAFFSTKPYDRQSFEAINVNYLMSLNLNRGNLSEMK
jgi:hypothetical protein